MALPPNALAVDDEPPARNVRGIYSGGGVAGAGSPGDDLAWRFMAWVRPIKNFAVEAGYVELDKHEDGLTVSGMPMIPIGPLDIYGKVGVTIASLSGGGNSNALSYGAGGAYQWKRLGARVEYERFDLAGTVNSVWFLVYLQLGEL